MKKFSFFANQTEKIAVQSTVQEPRKAVTSLVEMMQGLSDEEVR